AGLSVPAVKWPLLIPVKTVSFSLNGNLASMNTIPIDNGIPTKQSVTFKRHVPLAVHRLYKSTQTGSITKSGQSGGPLSSFKIRFVLFGVLPSLVLFWMWFLATRLGADPAASETGDPVAVESRSATSSGAVAISVPVPDVSNRGAQSAFVMPYQVTELFTNGASGAIYAGRFDGLVLFTGMRGKDEVIFNSDDLVNLGYKVDYLGDCYSVVTDRNGRAITVNCQPRIIPPESKLGPSVPENVTTFSNLTATPSA
ncbi:P-loop NTPase family protein, partial [Aeromonas salmonicida]